MDRADSAADTFVIDPAGRDIPGEATRLHALGPAARATLPGGIEAWVVTGHELLKSLFADDRVSKDPRQHYPVFQQGLPEPASWLMNWIGVTNMFTAYGPDHRRLRRLVSPAFTHRRTQAMVPLVEKITAELLDALDAAPAGEPVDLMAAFAHPLPMRVICELLGVPESSREDAARLIARIMDTTLGPEEAAATWESIPVILGGLIAAKAAEPADDITSVLIASVDDDGSTLTQEELLFTLLLVIGAGFETTVNLIGNAVSALLTHPEQLALVRSGERSWDDVTEETLRWAPSIANLPLRYAVEDIPLPDGGVIRQGEAIVAGIAGAGRDAAFHGPAAADFDVTRTAEHLAFGHGVHHCIGAPLARLEARTALSALFARFPDLQLAVPPADLQPTHSFIAQGHDTLPVLLR